MAPSQLAQLKAALSSGGLNRKSQSKKSKKSGGKKGGAQEVDRAKKIAKLDEIRARFNKFDERETRTKHDVGGRNLKGVVGRPTAARSAGIEARRETLLGEHHLRDHRGTFRDRRFGENDPTMSVEDRMLERYTRERQRGQGKKGMFNLEDDEGFDDDDGFALGLTHGGRSVMDLPGDDFDMLGMGDEEESGAISRQRVAREHFGGFRDEEDEEDEGERKKTKHEVMSEIIAKSKGYKLERQKQRDEDEEMREQLDDGLDELRELLAGNAPVKPAVQLPGVERGAPIADQHNDKDYDQFVRSLAFEARAKPKDRTKTEEEEAADEVARLQAAEAKRLRRMHGEESEDEEEGGKRRKDRAPDADDLGDDFMGEVDDEGNVLLGEGLTRKTIEEMAPESDEGSGDEDEDGESGEEGEEDDDEEEENDDDDDDDGESVSDLEDLDSDEASDDEAPQLVPVSKKRKAPPVVEIPFTFSCPATLAEFEDILEPLADSALPTVVQRIRALHHPSLAQGNKERLQDFLGVLLDYILVLASDERFESITALGPHLAALVKLNPLTASSHFIAKLTLMQKNLVRGLARGASNPTSKTMPGGPELTLLRLVGVTWSTSDFSHPVVQPAMLLMGQYLSQSRIRSTSDLASGLFMCSLVAQYEAESKRLMPEAINFLASSIRALLKRKKDAPFVRAYPNLVSGEMFLSMGVPPHHPINLFSRSEPEQTRSNLLAAALRLIQSFASLYSSLDAFVELFTPLSTVLSSSRTKLHPDLKSLFSQTASQLENQLRLATTSRMPLTLQDHKPIPIASYAPKFEKDFAPDRHYDPDVERNAAAKLRAAYKKERKGAIRELRKDNRFLASEKSREQAAKDDEYNAKMRKAHGSLNAERAEEKEMEREKRRDKRRRGN
ncbi:hypothetical protein CspHIS471_0704910 [Cutaneotrichosporon sp. HIS471]|nr:hypothetical protein CspHIS471_0704910 [Cutaneotrichosporon sp. HIS471]